MKTAVLHSILTLAAIACLVPAAALAFEPMAATVRVSGGGVYDYVVIGESPKATDGFDNAYDTLAPSGSLNSTYISTYFNHTDWKAPKTTFRGDIRSMAEKQEWILNVVSTLPAGTPLKVELTPGLNVLPEKVALTITNPTTSITSDLKTGSLTLVAPAPGAILQLTLSVQQPKDITQTLITPPVEATVDGDVDGSGQTDVADAIKVLRMALGLERTTAEALTHGDINGDGKLTVQDALAILRKSVGL